MAVIGGETGGTDSTLQSFGTPTPQEGQRVIMRIQTSISTGGANPTLGGPTPSAELAFQINPEDMSIDEPSRVSTVNTIAGAYQDNWGAGIGRMQINGNTGWRAKGQGKPDGFQHIKQLEALHLMYQELCASRDPDTVELIILLPPGQYTSIADVPNLSQNSGLGFGQTIGNSLGVFGSGMSGQLGIFRISSDNFRILRNRANPLLFRYQWDFTIIKNLLNGTTIDPSQRFVVGDPAAADPMSGGAGGILGGGANGSGTGAGSGTNGVDFPVAGGDNGFGGTTSPNVPASGTPAYGMGGDSPIIGAVTAPPIPLQVDDIPGSGVPGSPNRTVSQANKTFAARVALNKNPIANPGKLFKVTGQLEAGTQTGITLSQLAGVPPIQTKLIRQSAPTADAIYFFNLAIGNPLNQISSVQNTDIYFPTEGWLRDYRAILSLWTHA